MKYHPEQIGCVLKIKNIDGYGAVRYYESIRLPSDETKCGMRRVMLQRIIMEKIIDRPLLKTERVGHKDGNTLNNAEENLFIFNLDKSDMPALLYNHSLKQIATYYGIKVSHVEYLRLKLGKSCKDIRLAKHFADGMFDDLRAMSLRSVAKKHKVSMAYLTSNLKAFGTSAKKIRKTNV